jgi:hypothetical protein
MVDYFLRITRSLDPYFASLSHWIHTLHHSVTGSILCITQSLDPYLASLSHWIHTSHHSVTGSILCVTGSILPITWSLGRHFLFGSRGLWRVLPRAVIISPTRKFQKIMIQNMFFETNFYIFAFALFCHPTSHFNIGCVCAVITWPKYVTPLMHFLADS